LGLKGDRDKAGIDEIMNRKAASQVFHKVHNFENKNKILPEEARYRPSGENARE